MTRLVGPPLSATGDGQSDVGPATGQGSAAWLGRWRRWGQDLGWRRLAGLAVVAVLGLLLLVVVVVRLIGGEDGTETGSESSKGFPADVPASVQSACGPEVKTAGVSYQACIGHDAGRAYGWLTVLDVPDTADLQLRLELVQVEGGAERDGSVCPVEQSERLCGPVDAELGEGSQAVHYVRGAVLRDGEELPGSAQSPPCPFPGSTAPTEPASATALACP